MTVPPPYQRDSVMPIALTDSQLETVMRAAGVLNVYDRDDFLRAVAEQLSGREPLGDGIVARVTR